MSDNFVKDDNEVGRGDRIHWTFGRLLKWHFLRGTRPGGKVDHPGRTWTVKVFAEKVGVGDRAIRYWLRNEHLPPDTETVERVLFGNIETIKGADAYAVWRLELRHAHAKLSPKGGEDVSGGDGARPGHMSERDTAQIPRFPNYTRRRIVSGRTSDSAMSSLILKKERNNLRTTKNIITTEFKRSNAMFTVSGQQTLIVSPKYETLFGFKNLLCQLHKIGHEDEKERILIWILERWNQESSNEVIDKLRYENVQSLIIRFKAFTAYFGDPEAKATWDWLKSRAVVAIQEESRGRFDLSQNVLFGAVPNKWVQLRELRRLYGDDLSRVDRANYTVFLRPSVNSSSKKHLGDRGEEYRLRYFGHAEISAEGEDPEVRGAQLPSPGRDYDRAFAIVHAAAIYFLKLESTEEHLNKGKEADEKMRVLGCSLMRVEEFVNL